MIEYLAFLAVGFLIAILFYRQSKDRFEILQIDGERLSELPTLYQEKSPIVVRQMTLPRLGTESELRKRPHLLKLAVSPTFTLGHLLQSPDSLAAFTFTKESAEFLAKESGVSVWFQHMLFPKLLPSPYTAPFYTSIVSLWPHHRGLFKTTAFQTVVYPTQGTIHVSLLLSSMIPFLPSPWKERQFSKLTPQDTPLLSQIKFFEIIVRKGTLLLLPPHTLVDIRSSSASASASADTEKEHAWTCIAEIHHPISRIAT
jgi:hypothetical protein